MRILKNRSCYAISKQITPTNLEYSFIESINDGFDRAYWELLDYVGQFKHIFTKKGASQLGRVCSYWEFVSS